MKFKMVTLSIACKAEDAEHLANRLSDCDENQIGIYSFGVDTRDCDDQEAREVESQVPSDILDGYMQAGH